jgi:protease II
MQEQTLFIDKEKTHYLDIAISKDSKYLFIYSNTKEDSEVWILDRNDD